MKQCTSLVLATLAGGVIACVGAQASAQVVEGLTVPAPVQLTQHGQVGVFDAARAMRTPVLEAGRALRAFGDTFDSEPIVMNTTQTLFTFVADSTGGQSLPYDGFFHLAGNSVLNAFPVENGGTVFDNGDGTYTLSVQTRIEPLSDGFLPIGFAFSGDPITTIGWMVGNVAPVFDRLAPPDPLDPALSAEFPPMGAFDVVDANAFYFDNGVPLGSFQFSGLPFLNESEVSFGLTIGGADGSGIDLLIVDYLLQSATAPTELTLAAVDTCLDATENQLVVEINASGVHGANVGGQFFLQYDQTRLDFVSADAGDAPFTREIFEFVDEAAGTIDYAVGVPNGDPGTAAPTTMARLTFNVLADICQEADVVTFRPNIPPSRITDGNGVDLGAATIDLGEITKDSVPPVITAPADIIQNADAGGCTLTLDFVEPFDVSPSLCASQTPGCWFVDRYAPAAFESVFFDGDNRLLHSISEDDSAANRPPSFAGGFYDTQGRKYDVNIPADNAWSIDLYIASDWATNARRADIWATTVNSQNSISGFPILGFINNDPGDPFNTAPVNPMPRFRFFTQDTDQDPSNGLTPDWIELGLPPGFSYDRWWTLEVELTAAGYEYRVIDDMGAVVISGVDAITFGSVRARDLIVQAFNFGASYDVYWDNVVLGPEGPVATDNCSEVVVTFERSDDPALGLGDPFPVGTTTITWTATDACGNQSSDTQDIVVNASNTLVATVELQAVTAGTPGDPLQRCVTFELIPTGGGTPVVVEATLDFIAGVAVDAVIDIPCGSYECITARDTLHTLRSTDNDDFAVSGANYVANFTASGDGDELIGGNLNDDSFIDILDFGIFINQFGSTPGANTPCGTPAPHADISGDGAVGTADFTFVQNNFLRFSEVRCDNSLIRGGRSLSSAASRGVIDPSASLGPVQRISVVELRRRGLHELVAADLNRDGYLDVDDVSAFIGGARPDHLGDIDGDGDIDEADLKFVIDSISTGDPRADVDRNGVIDAADVAFVAARIGWTANR